MTNAILKPGREKPLKQHHPWIFSGALSHPLKVDPGSLVDFVSHKGERLGRGYYNPKTNLCGRVLTFNPAEDLDRGFWHKRLESALGRRASLLKQKAGATTGCRLVMSESDQLPGLIVDLYGSWLVVQVLTAGMDRLASELLDPLWDLTESLIREAFDPDFRLEGLMERSDDAMRLLEGLEQKVLVRRLAPGKSPPTEPVTFLENGIKLAVDLLDGQKTGSYHDQRDNRQFIGEMAKGLRVLDCCSYTGGFTLAAIAGGARQVVSIDQSATALERLRLNISRNFGDAPQADAWTQIQGDAFKVLRQLDADNERFDLVILDPPKFAAKESHIPKAARGYKDLNLWGLKLVAPGGFLATFSCSGHINPDLFQKIVFGASTDARRDAQISRWFNQGEDHPVLLSFPESHYLKGLLLKVL